MNPLAILALVEKSGSFSFLPLAHVEIFSCLYFSPPRWAVFSPSLALKSRFGEPLQGPSTRSDRVHSAAAASLARPGQPRPVSLWAALPSDSLADSPTRRERVFEHHIPLATTASPPSRLLSPRKVEAASSHRTRPLAPTESTKPRRPRRLGRFRLAQSHSAFAQGFGSSQFLKTRRLDQTGGEK